MKLCDIFNYADDNTICCVGDNIDDVKNKLQIVSASMMKWFDTNFMKPNPSKFQFIVFDRVYEECFININEYVLQSQRSVKLLGIQIDAQLKFDLHISDICKKAGRKLNVLARLSKILNGDAKFILFNSFILSHFNFCPLIWHFCSINDMKQMEKIQKRALMYTFNDFTSSYSELRLKAKRPLLYVHRLRLIVSEVYKCIHELNPSYLHNLIHLKEQNYNMRNTMYLQQPKFKYVKHGKHCFRYQSTKLWNMLDNKCKESITIKQFKQLIAQWNGPSCKCSLCEICVLTNL